MAQHGAAILFVYRLSTCRNIAYGYCEFSGPTFLSMYSKFQGMKYSNHLSFLLILVYRPTTGKALLSSVLVVTLMPWLLSPQDSPRILRVFNCLLD